MKLVIEIFNDKNVYSQDYFSKTYKFVRIISLVAAEAVLFELYIHGSESKESGQTTFNNLSFSAYFVMGPTIFIIGILALRTCCRDKESHPLGSRLSSAEFAQTETARRVSQTVSISVMVSLLGFYQAYLIGLAELLVTGNKSKLRRVSIIFAGVFVGLSFIAAYADQYFK